MPRPAGPRASNLKGDIMLMPHRGRVLMALLVLIPTICTVVRAASVYDGVFDEDPVLMFKRS